MKKVLENLKAKKNLSLYDFKPLVEEGSSKKFYRLKTKDNPQTYILMLADDRKRAKGTLQDWIHIAKALKQAGVRTPLIYEHYKDENALLMEDCKDLLLTDKINRLSKEGAHKDLKSYYQSCLNLLTSAQKVNDKQLNYILGKKTLYNDLMLFFNEHLKKRLQEEPKLVDEKKFKEEALSLCEYLNSSDCCFTHRDFHSRNILLFNKELILIDFQDACLGPRAYDLVSFVFDPYTEVCLEQKKDVFFAGLESLKKNLRKKQKDSLDDSWKAVTIQRLYKILGSYNFLGAMKGKEKFLQYIKPTLHTLESIDLFDKRWPYLTKQLKEKVTSFGK